MINEKLLIQDPAALKKQFQNDKSSEGPYIYLPLDSADSSEKTTKLITGYKKSGYSGIIPFTDKNSVIKALSDKYYETYDIIKKETDANQLKLAYLDDTYVMREYLSSLENPSEKICKILTKYEYTCTEGELMRIKLHIKGKLMSLVAVDDNDLTITDLREYVNDGILEWKVPEGNWNIEEYLCEDDVNSNFINTLDYDVSMDYLRATFGKLFDRYSAGKTQPFNTFIYRNVMFAGQNRRMWHENFNKRFEEEFGFDPAPYYTLMFRDYGGNSKRYKCMLMSCRAKMLVEGYLKAVSDYCKAHDVFCTGFPAESKAAACSWLFGDGQLLHKYSSAPGISMPFAYLYGLNGIRVAAGAADELGCDTVTADLFKYYMTLTRDIIYRESMNVFVRGVNFVFTHLGEDRTKEHSDIVENDPPVWGSIFSKGDDLTEYASFVSRIQTMLRGGEHVSEVAIIYPIHTLHSLVYLYQSETSGFEYPSTPENADYMELMNNFLNYVGIDSTFIHPDAIINSALAENGVLYLGNEKDKNVMKFKLLILPSMSIVSLKALKVVKKFYNEGGKIIATDNLPLSACECSKIYDSVNTAIKENSTEDEEVCEIIKYIFGEDVTDNKIYKRYYKNENSNGGVAYYLPSNKRSVDGTESVSADMLFQATENFGIAPDVYIDNMTRREFAGFVNYHLPAFIKVGVDKRLANGCSINYLHKRHAGCDIYYFTNTTGEDYNGSILLRGNLVPEEWNPYNGKIKKAVYKIVRFRGEIYTMIDAEISASSCTFYVSPIQRTQKELSRDLTENDEIPEFFPKNNF
ncbi:MAG: hypothetical protein ACI4XJ_01520 [Eubacteriales bacterium]